MHCLSCEILVEKILLQLPGVRSAKASLVREEVLIEYIGECPDRETMKNLLAEQGYHIACQEDKASVPTPKTNPLAILGISCLVIAVFLLLEKTGLSQLINVDSSSSLPIFFLFGLLAGVSSCAALVGGLVLSLSKQWSEFSPNSHSPIQRFQPHLLFNVGRLISYAGFGAVLGAAGSLLRPSPFFSSLLVMVISGIMIILGLQMLGVKWFRTLRFTMPRFITRYATNERHFIGR
ncbi:MAG: sulfite exporter TauE/SafE family protein, partial [Atribacterota bacterium]